MFKIEPECHGDILILRLSGDILLADAVEFNTQMEKILASDKISQAVIDLGQVGQVDNACLGVLVSLNTIYQNKGRRLVLLRPAPHVLEVLRQAEIEGFFPTFSSEDSFRGFVPLDD